MWEVERKINAGYRDCAFWSNENHGTVEQSDGQSLIEILVASIKRNSPTSSGKGVDFDDFSGGDIVADDSKLLVG